MIIVAGDSWGVGSWSPIKSIKNRWELTGTNFATLVSLHNDLGSINLCSGGTTLHEALDRYNTFLKRYTPDDSDAFYWIVTNPLRNINVNDIKIWTTIQQAADNILHDALQKANSLAHANGIKINLIGGLCDLNTSIVDGFDNLICSVPSWCKLIDREYVQSMFSDDSNWQEIGKYIKEYKPELLEEWLLLSNFILDKNNFYKKYPNYFKHGDNHPSVEANRILKDYLYPEWAHIF